MKRLVKSSRFVFSAVPSFEPPLALRRDPFILLFALFGATSVAGAV
jgi:hypothetical protein